MAEIVISEFMDEAAVADLRASFDVLYDKTLVDRPEELAAPQLVPRAHRPQSDAGAWRVAGRRTLRVVGRLGVGLDNIDCKACRERGIAVIPATGANNTAVAEYVLAGCSCSPEAAIAEHSLSPPGHGPGNVWWAARYPARCSVLSDSEGSPGTWRCAPVPVGMRVMAYDPFLPADAPDWEKLGVEPVMLETLLAEADAVSLHVPLTPDTRQLFRRGTAGAHEAGSCTDQYGPGRHCGRSGPCGCAPLRSARRGDGRCL